MNILIDYKGLDVQQENLMKDFFFVCLMWKEYPCLQVLLSEPHDRRNVA